MALAVSASVSNLVAVGLLFALMGVYTMGGALFDWPLLTTSRRWLSSVQSIGLRATRWGYVICGIIAILFGLFIAIIGLSESGKHH